MDKNPSDLLPVGAHALSADPRLADAVRRIGSTYGYDYFDDGAVRKTLSEHEAALRRLGRGGLVWAGSLATAVGIVWLVWAAAGRPDNMVVAAAPPAALLVLALAAFVQVNLQGRRKLRHPFLEGYRHVLAAARAHGAPVTFVPAWLTGRGGAALDVAPLPSYAAPPGRRPPAYEPPRWPRRPSRPRSRSTSGSPTTEAGTTRRAGSSSSLEPSAWATPWSRTCPRRTRRYCSSPSASGPGWPDTASADARGNCPARPSVTSTS